MVQHTASPSLLDNYTNRYHDFFAIADATFDMAAKSLGKNVKQKDKKLVLTLAILGRR